MPRKKKTSEISMAAMSSDWGNRGAPDAASDRPAKPGKTFQKPLIQTSRSLFSGSMGAYEFELSKFWNSYPTRIRTCKEMKVTSKVSGILKAIKFPIAATNWKVRLPDGIPPEFLKNAELDRDISSQAIFNRMEDSWGDIIMQILTMLDYGVSLFEILHKSDMYLGKRYWFYRNLRHIPADFLVGWEHDESDNLKSYNIQSRSNLSEPISVPENRILRFTFQKEGSDITGVPILRDCFEDYYYKKNLTRINAIGHEKAALGVPVIKQDVNESLDGPQKEALMKMLKDFRSHEMMALFLPFGYSLDKSAHTYDNSSIINTIRYHDEQMAVSCLAAFLNLGMTHSGSRALGDTLDRVLMNALNFIAYKIADTASKKIILPLSRLNIDNPYTPYLQHTTLSAMDFEKVATSVKSAYDSGNFTPDSNSENWFRDLMGAPEKGQTIEGDESSDPTNLTEDGVTDAPIIDPNKNAAHLKNGNYSLMIAMSINRMAFMLLSNSTYEQAMNDLLEHIVKATGDLYFSDKLAGSIKEKLLSIKESNYSYEESHRIGRIEEITKYAIYRVGLKRKQ